MWYEINNSAAIDTPALLVYPQRVQRNIERLITMVGDVNRLRPHVKTNKTPEVCAMLLAAGITRFKCATIAEAEMLAMSGAPDVLLAYQPIGPKQDRLLQLCRDYPATVFSCVLDDEGVASSLSALFEKDGRTLAVFIDVDNGMHRTGIAPGKAMQLAKTIHELPGLNLSGVHGYDGHVNDPDLMVRQQKGEQAFAKIAAVAATIREQYHIDPLIVTGGSPSFPVHIQRPGVQLSPGTFVFWDWGYQDKYPDEPFEYATTLLTRVLSIPDEHTICLDLGHKAVAAENPLPRAYFLNADDITVSGQSEEHLVGTVPDSSRYQVGDLLYAVPMHICPTVNLYDRMQVVENGAVTGQWKVTARDRSINI